MMHAGQRTCLAAPNPATVAAAYDAIAPDYDHQLLAGEAPRRRLWQRYTRLFHPGMRVLDVGCGTGIDAMFLASMGVQVVGIDISPGMVAELRRKVHQGRLAELVEPQVMEAAEIASWPSASFDGIIAAYAGLNTVADLAQFGRQAARLLRPGGRLLAHMLNCWSVWDLLPLLRHRQISAIAGRIRRHQRTVVIGGVPVAHVLYAPQGARRALSSGGLRCRHAYGFGMLTPPQRLPGVPPLVIAMLDRLERRIGGWPPLPNGGRSFLLELEKPRYR